MIQYNLLFLNTYSYVYCFFKKHNISFYPASMGAKYKDLFHRDSFACFAFYNSKGEQFYMYFNASYDSTINKMVFTSVSVVSIKAFTFNAASLVFKQHISSPTDLSLLDNCLRGVVV